MLKAPNLSLSFESSKVVVSSAADLAVATGPYKLAMDGPKGQRIEEGKFVEAWTRVNGEWKVLGNIFNSDKSPT
jgi:ketosteroid isomerase-like protein